MQIMAYGAMVRGGRSVVWEPEHARAPHAVPGSARDAEERDVDEGSDAAREREALAGWALAFASWVSLKFSYALGSSDTGMKKEDSGSSSLTDW